jgi:hypothetical protein
MNIGHFYTDTVTLYYVTESISTVTGENVKTNSVGTNLKCKIRPLTNYEQFIQNKNSRNVSHRIYCAQSTAFVNVDRIEYGGITFEIKGIINPFNKNEFMQVDVGAIV